MLCEDRSHFLATFGKQFLGASLLNFSVTTYILQWTLMMAVAGSPKATIDCVNAFAETNFRRDMEASKLSTLIVRGDADLCSD